MTLVIRMLTGLLVNSLVGISLALLMNVQPITGAIAINVIGIIMGFMPIPVEGHLFEAMVYKETWEIEMIKALYKEPKFLAGVKEKKATNNSIKLRDLGAEPGVLIDNESYPIPAVRRTDTERSVDLHKFQTEVTEITDDDLYTISYDKIRSVNEDHKRSIEKGKYARAIHNIAPDVQSTDMPILEATGTADATGRATLTPGDVVRFRKEFLAMGISEGEDLRLVLNYFHWLDLMQKDEAFLRQYKDMRNGELLPLYGFSIYNYGSQPYYFKDTGNDNKWTRRSFGVTPVTGDCLASTAFYKPRTVQSIGDTKFYWKKAEPREQMNEINYRHYHLAMRKAFDAVGVLLSETS